MSLFNWLIEWTNRTFVGAYGLFVLAFIESSFFPVPPDLVLIALSLAEPSLALYFALICTIGSVLGAMFGYGIGYYGGKPILIKLFSESKVNKVHKLFQKYEAWAIFIAGFTPIPYKVFTIAGGAFYVNFKKFVIASVFSRGLRFFIEAVLIIYFGDVIVGFLSKDFNLYSLVGFGVLFGLVILWKRYTSNRISYFDL